MLKLKTDISFGGFDKNLPSSQGTGPLEPVCCKKRQKSSLTVTGLGTRGPLKILNGTKLILDDQEDHFDSSSIIN